MFRFFRGNTPLTFLLVALCTPLLAQAPAEPGKRPHPRMRHSRFDASRPPAKAARPPGLVFRPLVEFKALNAAYVQELARRRRIRQPLPAGQKPVQFDSLLLPGTVLHNQRLVTANEGLFHDLRQPHAELCGYRSDLMRFRNQPAQLAHAIWQQLDDSKTGHKQIQQNHEYTYVSVSCSNTYFVVRLDRGPSTPTAAESKGFSQWQMLSRRSCAAETPFGQPVNLSTSPHSFR